MMEKTKFIVEPLWIQQSIDGATEQLSILEAIDLDAQDAIFDDDCSATVVRVSRNRNSDADVKKIKSAFDDLKKQQREFVLAQIFAYKQEIDRLLEEKKKYGYVALNAEENEKRDAEEKEFHDRRFDREYEEKRRSREAQYKTIVDPLTSEMARTVDAASRADLQEKIDALVLKIRSDFPYPDGYPK